jgi:predicted metal-dependent peptidase
MQVDLETESQNWGSQSGNLMMNIREVNREKYDYTAFLKKFAVLGEAMQINDDEFDYIFYTHGLDIYGNVPLVEPLEYKDSNKIKEFVIALDTSASCKGAIVQAFLKKTYSILKSSDNFFSKVNIHIIQCDSKVVSDTKITDEYDFEEFCANVTLKGFGSTDFRPVFDYVDEMNKNGEFENLKGVIYFTDGYGTYPESMPEYDALFAFLKDDPYAPKLPPWAYRVILEPEELEAEAIRLQEEEEKAKAAKEG